MDFKELLFKTRVKNGLATEVTCSDEKAKIYEKLLADGKTLPEGIYKKDTDTESYFYYYLDECNISQEEMKELLLNLQLKSINTIKKCVIFFTVLAIISLSIGAIIGILISFNL